jgi:hypothetical protein
MTILNNIKNIINTIIYDILLNIINILLENTFKFLISIFNIILFIPKIIYEYYTFQCIIFIIFAVSSLSEIGAITTTSLYLTRCNFENNDDKDKINNLIYLSFAFISFILLKRFYFIISYKYPSNNDKCIAFLKLFMNIFIAAITHSFQIILCNKVNTKTDCSSNFITNDRNIWQIIIGCIVSIYELEIYNGYFSSLFNRNNYSNSRIYPIETNNNSNIIIVINNNNDNNIINSLKNKINNIPNININDSEYINNSCSICLENNDNFIKLSNCDHYFHKDCINKWISQDIKTSSLCPVCRINI